MIRAFGFGLLICFSAASASAEAANVYADAIAKYEVHKFGGPLDRTILIHGVRSVAIPSRKHVRCTRPGRAFLVGFSHVGADDGEEALEFRAPNAPCSDCITSVASAAGGALDRAELISFGLTAAQAATLIPRDP